MMRSALATLVVTSLLLALAPQPLGAASGRWRDRSDELPGMSTSEVVKKALIIAAVVGVVMVVAMVSLKNKKTHESEKQAPAAADTVRTGAWIPGGMQSAPIGLRGTTPAATALWQPRTWEGDLALARGDGARSMQPSPANGGELVSEIGR